MQSSPPDLLTSTAQPRYPNGQRKLAHNVFMQTTWGLLALTALAQVFLLVWMDLMS
jgi:hypothetical protein